MPTLWIPGAEHLPTSSLGGDITSDAPARAVWHTVEAKSGSDSAWTGAIRTLNAKEAEPHLLYDPIDDRLGQFLALNTSARALKNDGGTRTNRVGKACIQIEVVARSNEPFTGYWSPGPRFRALMAALRSWGIPDTWPAGQPPVFVAIPPHNVPESPRPRSVWLGRGGHYGHSQIPGNDHGDPGGIDIRALFAAATTPPPTQELFTVGQYENLMQQIKNEGAATRQEVRRQAIWSLRYGVQTEDERARADAAFDAAIADGKTLAEAIAAVSAVMKPIDDDLAKRASDNG